MLRFLTRCLAVIGFLVVLAAVGGAAYYVHQTHAGVPEPDATVLVVDFAKPITEQPSTSPFDLALHDETTPLLDILRAIDQAALDPHVKALVARFGSEQPSLAQAQELRDAILRFRETKKPTFAFGSTYGEFGLGNRAYYLASEFEQIWLQPVGTVSLTGLAMQEPFAKTALDKIGVQGEFMQREEYKSFMDMAMRDDFAPPVKQNLQDLLTDLNTQEANGIGEGRGMQPVDVKALMAKGPFTDEEGLNAKLVTKLGYADELDQELERQFGKDVKDVDVGSYLGFGEKTGKKSKAANGTKIAMIYGEGMILDRAVGGLGQDKVMAADDIASAFEAVAEDKDVKAVIFRIDSPGGSPAASETIRRAMIHAQAKGKPVFVTMGDVAASGGYWVAMNADYIAAEPGTLTGSIGVIAGKFNGAGLLQKLGITVGTVKTADNAGLWSMTEGFTPDQRERVNALLDASYKTFVTNVATARKIPLEKMPDIAKGRVWTGQQAKALGLVDELGGYDVTLGALRKKLNLTAEDAIDFEQYPPPQTPVDKVMKLLKGLGVENAMIGSALVQWQSINAALGPVLEDAQLGDTPVLARMPEPMTRLTR